MQHDGAVDFGQEALCRPRILGDDAFGVVGAVIINMGDSVPNPVHDFHRDDAVEIFRIPICRRGRHHAAIGTLSIAITTHFTARIQQILDQRRQMRGGALLVYQQGFRGAADTGAAQLGVQGYLPRHG